MSNKPAEHYKFQQKHRDRMRVAAKLLLPKPKKENESCRPIEVFQERMRAIKDAHILEVGTRVQETQDATRRDSWFPNAARYVGVDYMPGEGVDIVADVHRLTDRLEPETFDGALSLAVFEHVKYPWLGALEMAKVTKIGGFILVMSVHTFPLHSSPYDYWRFSLTALETIFPASLGVRTVHRQYNNPAIITSPFDETAPDGLSFMASSILVRKIAETPDQFPYEYDELPG